VLGVLLLGVIVLELLLVPLMLFGAGGDVRVLFGEDADNTGGDFLVNYSPIVFAYDVASEFLGGEVSIGLKS
jgi:hypothetical protein